MGLRDYIREADRPEDLMAKLKDLPGGALPFIATRVRRLDSIISGLRKNAFAPEMKVFGDAVDASDSLPNDIRIFVDYSRIPLGREIAGKAMGELLSISKSTNGMLVPYVLVKGKLFTRDEESNRWITAKKPRDTVSNGRRGIPLTLFDKSFTTIAHAGLSEGNGAIRGYIERAERERTETVIFEGYEIPARMLRDHTPMEIAMILGGH